MQIGKLRMLGRDALVGVADAGQEIFEADLLLAHVLGASRVEILSRQEVVIDPEHTRAYLELLEQRKTHAPIAYLLGEKEFFGIPFRVTPDVLIPRPETELLVELLLSRLIPLCEEGQDFTLIDVGTGSGAILLSVLKTLVEKFSSLGESKFIGLDRSEEALEIAALNATRLGIFDSVFFGKSDLLGTFRVAGRLNLEKLPRPVLTVANLPYVPDSEILPKTVEEFEPYIALRGGEDGLKLVRRLISEWYEFSVPGDEPLFLEIGEGQAAALLSEASQNVSVHTYRDLREVERVVELSKVAQHE